MAKLGFDLILLGSPAGGKDTQAILLRKKYKLKPVESGKYWKKLAVQKNKAGESLRRTYSKGLLAPVKLMKHFIVKTMTEAPKNGDLIFIGNPRMKPEAQLLVKLMKKAKRDFFVINLVIPPQEIRQRSKKRLRDLQDWKYVENRIKMNRLQVTKTLNYFKSINKLKTVDGNQPVKVVARDTQKVINDYQRSSTTGITQKKRANTR